MSAIVRQPLTILSRRMIPQSLLRRHLEEFSKEWTEELKLAKKTYSRGAIRDDKTTSPQYYNTTMDDNYQKTTATFLNETADKSLLMIRGYSVMSFRLSDGTVLMGPVAMFPKIALSWMVHSIDDITEESLEFFNYLEPKLDVLLIGVGDKENVEPMQLRLRPYLIKNKLNAEIMATTDAGATFNFLNAEGRNVAACLFPPDRLPPQTSEDVIRFASLHDVDANQLPTFEGNRDIFGLVNRGDSLFARIKNTIKDERDANIRQRQLAKKELEEKGDLGSGGKFKQ